MLSIKDLIFIFILKLHFYPTWDFMKKVLFPFYWILTIIVMTYTSSNAQSTSNKRYEAVEGKIVGIWPHNDRIKSPERLKELKDRWGFNYILLAAVYGEKEKSLANYAGFDSLHIMHQIYLPDLINDKELVIRNIKNVGKIWAYYFDEPISREHSYIQFLNLIKDLSNNGFYPHAKFIVSELDENKAARLLRISDAIMYSGYGNRAEMGLDQVKTWKEWKEYLGEKFSLTWISSDQDSSEYRTLFKAARDLGFNAVWFYALEPISEGEEVNDSNYEKFCEAAVEYGFMKLK